VQRDPKDPAAYSSLGRPFFSCARETGDVEDFQLAEQALNKSLALNNADFSAEPAYSTMAEVCMGEHRFTRCHHLGAQKAWPWAPEIFLPLRSW